MTSERQGNSIPWWEQDHGRKAGNWLVVLGWLNIVGLNLGGVLWIWIGNRIKGRRNGFRQAAMWILGVHLAIIAGAAVKALIDGAGRIRFFGGAPYEISLGLAIAILAFLAVVFAVPFVWLIASGTRKSFLGWKEQGLCMNCGYDLRATPHRCPECGREVTPSPSGRGLG